MVFRLGILLIACWALLGVPTLCSAGVLLHECECAEGAQCGHETDCSSDPCATIISAYRSSQLPPQHQLFVALADPILLSANTGAISLSGQHSIYCALERVNIPYPHSDLPLLL
jgi:hypothetical protein